MMNPKPKRLLIVWWSDTGATEALVRAALAGAQSTDDTAGAALSVMDVRCDRMSPAALRAADGFLFATPECLGTLAGPMKAFVDRCYYPVLDQLSGRPWALMVSAGSDGQGAIRQFERIALGWRLRTVTAPLRVITHAQTPQAIAAPKTVRSEDLARAHELGATLGAGLTLGLW
jgi:multimeric flavodoxin WrbA